MKLKIFLLFAISAVFFVFVAFRMQNFTPTEPAIGDLVFPSTNKVNKIVFRDKTKEVVLIKEQGVWMLNDYPADSYFVELFLSELGQSAFIFPREIDADSKPSREIHIELFEDTKNLLSFDLSTFFAFSSSAGDLVNKLTINNKEYFADGIYHASADASYWYVQPLFPFYDEPIESIEGLEHINLQDLRFLEVVKASTITPDEQREFTITMRNGIVINGVIYKVGEDYWLVPELSTAILIHRGIGDYVKKVSPLYEGWAFRLKSKI